MAIDHITSRTNDHFIHIETISRTNIADVTEAFLLHIIEGLNLLDSLLKGRSLWKFFELSAMETIRDGLAVEGTLVFILGNGLRDASMMKEMHSTAINKTGIFIQRLITDRTLLGHLLLVCY